VLKFLEPDTKVELAKLSKSHVEMACELSRPVKDDSPTRIRASAGLIFPKSVVDDKEEVLIDVRGAVEPTIWTCAEVFDILPVVESEISNLKL